MKNQPQTQDIIRTAGEQLKELSGHIFDLLTVSKPITPNAAINLSKVVSKLSPLLGNLIEFNTVEFLNDKDDFKRLGEWKRQDPGFPDTIFEGVTPTPGFEIKAWFPLATEITARFKDSQNHFVEDNTHVCMLAWLPENILYGKPFILDVVVVSGASVAKARDDHYHNPPNYIVMEPEDTVQRTINLQQTNTNGYILQEASDEGFEAAQNFISSWGSEGRKYSTAPEYQAKLRELMGMLPYRLDTNYAKMDRIVHEELEAFKTRVLLKEIHGMTVNEWSKLFRACDKQSSVLSKAKLAKEKAKEKGDQLEIAKASSKQEKASAKLAEAEARVKTVLAEKLNITEEDIEQILE